MLANVSTAERLQRPVRVTDQQWPDDVTPVVSVICVTYNHKRFISECLDGFLMQETTFPIEIVVRDDASFDGTAEIVRKYHSRYPKLIRPVLHEKNQYTNAGAMIEGLLDLVKGEYYAACEGDDYWTHAGKLEEQVEILAHRPDLVMVSHEVGGISEFGEPIPRWRRLQDGESVEYTDRDVLRNIFNHPNTWVVRTNADLSDAFPLFRTLPMGDDPWNLALLQHGRKGLSLGYVWSVYRQHSGGIWSSQSAFRKACQELALIVSHRNFYAPRYDRKYDAIVSDQRTKLGLMLSDAVTRGKVRQTLQALTYLTSFRSPFFSALPEIGRIAQIGAADVVYRVSNGVTRRLIRRVQSLFAKT